MSECISLFMVLLKRFLPYVQVIFNHKNVMYVKYTAEISERWVLKNLDIHLERTISELELKSEKSKIVTFSLEFNGQVLVKQD